MTALAAWVDGAVGETRTALVRDGVPIMLHVARWSDDGVRPLWGEVYVARVRTMDRRRRGAFLDLGLGPVQGFVRCDAQGRVRTATGAAALVEGQAVRAHVRREGVREKNAVLDVLEVLPSADALGRVARAEEDRAAPADDETRERLDALIEGALAREAPVPGGGVLTIERTAALSAIDVDAGTRGGERDAERFARALNVDAAAEAARQLRLRGIGGLVAIDFVSMRDPRGRAAVMEALKQAVADDPWGVIVAPMSRFGVVELSRGQLRTPLADLLCDPQGALTAETAALAALRGLEREVRAARGRRVWLTAGAAVFDWLQRDPIGWRSALTARIGAHWEVRQGPGLAPGAWRAETD